MMAAAMELKETQATVGPVLVLPLFKSFSVITALSAV